MASQTTEGAVARFAGKPTEKELAAYAQARATLGLTTNGEESA